jgi:hypothetical protein
MAVGPPKALRRGQQDIAFTLADGSALRLTVFRDKNHRIRISRRAATAEEGQTARLKETPRLYDDLSQGAGFGRRRDDTPHGYHYGTFLWARDRGLFGPAGELTEVSLGGVSVTSIHFGFNWGPQLYLSCNNQRMLKVINNGPSVTATDGGVIFPNGATSLDCATFRDKAWVALGQSVPIHSFNGSAWAQAAEPVYRDRFAVTNWTFGAQMASSAAGISTGFSQRTLVSYAAGNLGLYHCVGDPGLVGNHVGPNKISDDVTGIQVFHATAEAVFAGTPQGVFLLTGGGRMPNLTPTWRDHFDSSNGAELAMFDSMLFASMTTGLVMVSPDPSRLDEHQWCHPGAFESFENSPVRGWPRKLLTDSGYLLAWFWNGTRSYMMAGKRADRLGLRSRNPMIWQGAENDVDGAVTYAKVLPSVNGGPRWLLFATLDAANVPHLWTQELPKEPSPYAAWKTGATYRSSPTFSVNFGADDLGDADAPKVARYWGAVTENASSTNTLTLSTRTDQGSPVTQMTVNESPRVFAVNDETSARGHLVELTATGRSAPTSPLWIRAIKSRGTINDEKTVVITVPVVLGRGVRGQNDGAILRDSRATLAQVYDLLTVGPVSLSDWAGRDLKVVLEDIQEDEVDDPDGVGTLVVATLTISVLLTGAGHGRAAYGAYGSAVYDAVGYPG